MGKLIDISGNKYNRLTVIKLSINKRGKCLLWECVCECGNYKIAAAPDLKCGKTKSCGCLNREILVDRNTRHGKSNTRIYNIWAGMIKRCTNPQSKYYHLYGGRGIKVCDRWTKFSLFYEDMKNGYSDELSLDRYPNNDGHYEPGNTRWATCSEQANNKRSNHLLEFNGEKHTISVWSEKIGISSRLIEERIRRGWPPQKAITLPKQKVINNRRYLKGRHVWDTK